MKKTFKRIFFTLLIVILVLTGIYFYFQMKVQTSTESFSSTVSENVIKILQLSTLEYNYTDVVSFKESTKYNNVTIPFTEKKFLIKYTGYVKAGSDLSNIIINISDPETIDVKLNRAVITDNVINEEDLYVYDEKESIFNKLKISDVYDVLVEEKEKTKDKLIENGFLKEADERSYELVTELLRAMNFKNINISFQ